MTERLRDFDDSNRSRILAGAVEPFVRQGDSVLDVGCGFAHFRKFQGTILPRLLHDSHAIRYRGIDNRADVIAACRAAYPWAEFTVGDAATTPLRQYDAVFHLGFDRKDLSDAWKAHESLRVAGFAPRLVLLEAGSPVGKQSKHLESFAEVFGAYIEAGYEDKAVGRYRWTYDVTQPDRRYAVLERT